jgi:L-iditol 2-dehydrogenase
VPRIAAIDPVATRLAHARALGATETIVAGADAGAAAAGWGRGSVAADGADLAIEAVGSTPAVRTAIDAVTRGGTVVLVGNVSPEVDLPLQQVVTRQIRLQGSCCTAASGNIDLSGFVSRVAPLAEGPKWFDRLHRQDPELVKVALTP